MIMSNAKVQLPELKSNNPLHLATGTALRQAVVDDIVNMIQELKDRIRNSPTIDVTPLKARAEMAQLKLAELLDLDWAELWLNAKDLPGRELAMSYDWWIADAREKKKKLESQASRNKQREKKPQASLKSVELAEQLLNPSPEQPEPVTIRL
jgi:hypothetical protein